jgi:hypothetical protein
MWWNIFLYTIHDPSNKEEGPEHFTEVKSSTPIQKPSGLHPPWAHDHCDPAPAAYTLQRDPPAWVVSGNSSVSVCAIQHLQHELQQQWAVLTSHDHPSELDTNMIDELLLLLC